MAASGQRNGDDPERRFRRRRPGNLNGSGWLCVLGAHAPPPDPAGELEGMELGLRGGLTGVAGHVAPVEVLLRQLIVRWPRWCGRALARSPLAAPPPAPQQVLPQLVFGRSTLEVAAPVLQERRRIDGPEFGGIGCPVLFQQFVRPVRAPEARLLAWRQTPSVGRARPRRRRGSRLSHHRCPYPGPSRRWRWSKTAGDYGPTD